MSTPLIALQRMRTETGAVVLPGCPIPGSEEWSATVRNKRIKQGFAAEPEKPKKKRATKKPASKES
tara:strand:+ start:3927 stop:4124 length:198 start_codon:yes stop_codon:yes gene_type:complete